MIGEVPDDAKLTTAEIANPSLRSQYQNANTPVATEVVDDRLDVDGTRVLEEAHGVIPDRTTDQRLENRTADQKFENSKPGQLFPDSELNELRARWDKTQIGFVDEPRAAVESADSLVATVVKRIAEQFAAERAELEHQWDRGDNVSTEDLRQALRRYRSFFDRLLTF